jgi:hypothetical protein
MIDQKSCENGSQDCDFDRKHEQLLVGELMQTIERYSKKNKINSCPSCLRDTMLSIAALLHLEAAKAGTAKTGKQRPGKRLGETFAKAARSQLESVRQTIIFKSSLGKH